MDDTPQMVEALRDLLKIVNRHEADHRGDWIDHACGECVGWDAELVKAPGIPCGWLCGRHRAMAVLAALPAPSHTTFPESRRICEAPGCRTIAPPDQMVRIVRMPEGEWYCRQHAAELSRSARLRRGGAGEGRCDMSAPKKYLAHDGEEV